MTTPDGADLVFRTGHLTERDGRRITDATPLPMPSDPADLVNTILAAAERDLIADLNRDAAPYLHSCGCPRGVGEDIRGHNPATCRRWLRELADQLDTQETP